jgi:hypothetical protein
VAAGVAWGVAGALVVGRNEYDVNGEAVRVTVAFGFCVPEQEYNKTSSIKNEIITTVFFM